MVRRMTAEVHREQVLALAIGATLPLWWKPLSWWLALAPSPIPGLVGFLGLAVDLMLIWAFFAALLTILVAPLFLSFRATRRKATRWAVVSLAFVHCFIVGEGLGRKVWRRGIENFVQRSEPLIRAISDYESREGRPPGSLADLVPVFLPAVPAPGLGGVGRYIYLAGDEAQEYARNTWALRVSVPCHPMGFDQMLYFPKHNFPEEGYGGWLERFGGWAYVHE
jgi:hypothetical protein